MVMAQFGVGHGGVQVAHGHDHPVYIVLVGHSYIWCVNEYDGAE